VPPSPAFAIHSTPALLTKDLIRCRRRQGKLIPQFIDVEDPELLELAQALLGVYASGTGETREHLEARAQGVLEGFSGDAVLGRGFDKLLQDRTEFEVDPASTFAEFRARIFLRGAQALRAGLPETPEAFRQKLAQEFGEPPEVLSERLYQDLPPYQRLKEFRELSAPGLLRRYNVSLVQSLLLTCDRLELTLPESHSAELRQLLKFLRFHQLLVQIEQRPRPGLSRGSLKLQVDGPMGLYAQAQKYGLNLANFFPAVLHQPRWSLRATVRLRKNEPEVLELDETCRLSPIGGRFLAYVPEELTRLQEAFAQKLPDWELEAGADFLALGGESYCFPDYRLTHPSGVQLYLELFHPWHAGPLEIRLRQLEQHPETPLLLGVMRALLKNDALAAQLEASEHFEHSGFLYRDLPTADKLKPLLGQRLARTEPSLFSH
jgi:predicted nuclease of restriction endonuclease-like RecB superfamily